MKDSGEKHFLTIDILKGIAIWMVIMVHSRQKFDNLHPALRIFDIGQMGCQMFFVISGFSAMLSYGRMVKQPHSVQTFYRKRVSSIIPGWYIMIFITYILNTISLALSGNNIGYAANRQPLSILCNLLLLHGLLPFCNNNVAVGGWYIGTLMIFYLITPIVYRCLTKKSDFFIRCIPWIAEAASCILILGIYFLTRNKRGNAVLENNRFIYFSFINQLGCFLLGVSFYFEEKKKESVHFFYVPMNMLLLFIVFFSNWKIAYIIVPFIMGLLTYHLMKCMLAFEERGGISEENIMLRILRDYGRHSYYIYLVHGLFVWSMPIMIRQILISSGLHIDDTLLYLIMIVPIFVLSYYTALLLQKVVFGIESLWKGLGYHQ